MYKITKRQRTLGYGKIIETKIIEIERQSFEVEIRLTKTDYGNYKYTVFCQATEEEYFTVKNEDVNEALKELKKELEERFKIKWSDFIHIKVDSEKGYGRETSDGLSVGIIRVRIGDKVDGEKCHQEYYESVPFDDDDEISFKLDSRIQNGLPDIASYHEEDDDRYGLIPWSQKSWDKLKLFISKIKDLRDAISNFITGEDANSILANLSKAPALLAPKKKRKKK